MDYRSAIEDMTSETYERLKRAVEIGKWPDGKPLTPEQREATLQAVIAWGELHLEEAKRVGFLPPKPAVPDGDEPRPLNWRPQERKESESR